MSIRPIHEKIVLIISGKKIASSNMPDIMTGTIRIKRGNI
jgi:hypothetical protein